MILFYLGYDKLKPYGFPIHGCICGYSRRIIWLELVKSNNNPKIPARLYLDAVEKVKGCPMLYGQIVSVPQAKLYKFEPQCEIDIDIDIEEDIMETEDLDYPANVEDAFDLFQKFNNIQHV